MKKALAAVGCLFVLWAILSIFPTVAQIPQFPQNLPPNTVVGRTGITAGPGQAIPFSQLLPLVTGSVSPGSITNAMLANMPAFTSKCNPTASAAQPQDCSTAGVTSVKGYGALGNSNGTTGNGNDDTSAIAAALNDTGNAYVPCGTYRITSTISMSSATKHYNLHGDGYCSQIYLDTGINGTAFNFSSPACCCVACLQVSGINFTTPTTGAGSVAINTTNEQESLFEKNFAAGYAAVFNLHTSYAPRLIENTATQLLGGLLNIPNAGDQTLFNGIIWRNVVQNSGATSSTSVMNLNCNGAFNLSVLGNDVELNYAGIAFTSCNSVDFSDNFLENNTTYNFQWFGTNTAFSIRNNWFGQEGATNFGNITKAVFSGNTIGTVTAMTFTSTALGVIIDNTNVALGSGSLGIGLPTPTVSACGTGSPTIVGTRHAGTIQEGTGATGCTVTFELQFDTANPVCVVTGRAGGITPLISALSQTAFTVTHGAATNQFFDYNCSVYRQ